MAFTVTTIEAALSKVQNGQSYTVDGFTYKRGDLETLMNIRRELNAEAAAENKTQYSLAQFGPLS